MPFVERARAIRDRMIQVRRDLHRHPELSFREHRTAEAVATELRRLGYEPRTGVGRTGIVAELANGSGPRIALRADMDALPIAEDPDHDYGSTIQGVMHACGHDAHVAGLLGAAELLRDRAREGALPAGAVRFLFQPSEEGTDAEGKSGATRMVEDGAMDGVDVVVGLHVGAQLPLGRVFLNEGPFMAGAAEVDAVVRGQAAHGARPQDGVDALVLAAQAVLAVQQGVARRIAPNDAGVVTFGQIQGGDAPNIVADRVRLTGTYRYFTEEVKGRLEAAIRGAFQTVEPMGGTVAITIKPGYPPVVNDPGVTAQVVETATRLLGPESVVWEPPMLEAEDFGILARQARGVFFWLGAALPEPRLHHHPRFDIDEAALPLGAALLAGIAEDLLATPPDPAA